MGEKNHERDGSWTIVGAPLAAQDTVRPRPRWAGALRHSELGRNAWRALLDAVLPPSCLSCEALVAEHGGLCPECWPKLRWIDRPFCAVTGAPMAVDLGDDALSPLAIASPPPFERARAAVMFDAIPRRLVHRLKYNDDTAVAPWLARWMARAGAELVRDCDAIVPVPLHRRRLIARRFNQSAERTRQLARLTGLAHAPHWLERSRATKRQVGLGHAARRRNVAGAFTVPEAARAEMAGRRVLLVDDVLTTGATVSAATRALKRGGASAVDVLTFARVDHGDDGKAFADAIESLTIDA